MGRRPEPGPGGVTREAAVALMAERGIGYRAAASWYAGLHSLSEEDAAKLQRKIKRWAAWARGAGKLQSASKNSSKPQAPPATPIAPASKNPEKMYQPPAEKVEEEKPPPPAPPAMADITRMSRVELAEWHLHQLMYTVEHARWAGHTQAAQRALAQIPKAAAELEAAREVERAALPAFNDDMTPEQVRAALEDLAGRLHQIDLEVFVAEFLRRTGAQLVGGEAW